MHYARTICCLSLTALATACTAMQSPDTTLRLDRDTLAAVDRMTAARCERARACGAPNADGCFERLRVTTSKDVRLSRCASKIDEPTLRDCVRRIQTETCDTALENVTRFRSCTVGVLCEPGPDEGTV